MSDESASILLSETDPIPSAPPFENSSSSSTASSSNSSSSSKSNHDLNLSPVESDIEGLRGIAVLAIVLFHVNGAWLPGGFVGVDVFFVISGYLITRNIAANLDDKTFSFSDFYAKRVRRISPAAMMTIFASFVIGCILFTEYDLRNLCHGVLAAVLGSTNVYETYFADYGYFAAKSAMNPLLHLWSLAVEEQFYFVWPMVMKQLWQFPFRMRIGVVGLIVLASFVWAQIAAPSSFAYYMLPCRAGELLVGALTALLLREVNDEDLIGGSSSARFIYLFVAAGFVGCVCVFGSFVLLNERMVFPGFAALPATVGTALAIVSGFKRFKDWSIVSKLSLHPLRVVGEASYSVYLCHWPVLAFFRYLHIPTVGAGGLLTTFAYIVASSILLHRFVESPLRRVRWTKIRIFVMLLVFPIVIIGAVSATVANDQTTIRSPSTSSLHVTKNASAGFVLRPTDCMIMSGNPNRQAYIQPPLPWANLSRYGDGWTGCYPSLMNNVCFLAIGHMYDGRHCVYSKEKLSCTLGDLSAEDCDKDAIGYFGDSHGAHYIGMVEEFAIAANFRFYNFMRVSCRSYYYPGIDPSLVCNPEFPKLLQRFRGRTVIWVNYFGADYNSVYEQHIAKTLDYMLSLDIRVLVLGTIAVLKSYPNPCPYIAPAPSSEWYWCSSLSYLRSCLEGLVLHNNWLKNLVASRPNASYWDANDYICSGGICYPYINGVKIYVDTDHITYRASRAIGRHIVETAGVPAPFLQIKQRECKKKQSS